MILTAMNNKTIKGYWSNGRFVKPEEILAEEPGPPSKTQLKAEAGEKQVLGEALLTLRPDLIKRLNLPEKNPRSDQRANQWFSPADAVAALG
jgi:ribosome-associated protein